MWSIEQTDTFEAWFFSLEEIERENVLASVLLLRERGPMLSRPHADTVNGSQHSNMKELRVQCQGRPIRVFLRLTHVAQASCYAQAIKVEMTSASIMR